MMKYKVIVPRRSLFRSVRQQSTAGFYMKPISPRKQAPVQDAVSAQERRRQRAELKKRVQAVICGLIKRWKA